MDPNNELLQKLAASVEKLTQELDNLKQRRVYQSDVIPGAIKNRAMGEANSYIYAGLDADLPTQGNQVPLSTTVYFATDTGVLYIWDGSAYVSVTLS